MLLVEGGFRSIRRSIDRDRSHFRSTIRASSDVGPKSEDFSLKLKSLVTSSFPQVDFNVAFKTPTTIVSFFPFKDKTEDKTEAQALVVYKLKCNSCELSYIGKTERILSHRIKEHQTSITSACFQHS